VTAGDGDESCQAPLFCLKMNHEMSLLLFVREKKLFADICELQ